MPEPAPSVVDWLLDSDPAIRWQVMRDVLDRPEEEWAAERARVADEGWGARLLALEDPDGQWAGGAHFPGGRNWQGGEEGQPWTSTSHSLSLLREFGIDPARMQRSVALIGENCRWEYDDEPYWEGEVEPCINGQLVANGAYLGVDMGPVVARLAGETLADGGWNCEAERGSVRSSFHSTLDVLEGLLEYERATGGTPESRAARRSGEEFLLERHLFKRLSTGEPAAEHLMYFIHPARWYYDVLRALDHFRAASLMDGAPPDPRLGEAIDYVRSRRREDGRWDLDWSPTGRAWFDVDDGPGRPSRWITLRALRVLKWWDAAVGG
jgi:hypothetical protein